MGILLHHHPFFFFQIEKETSYNMRMLNNSPNQNLKHFSHPHELELWNITACSQNSTFCSCCKLPLSGYVCGCSSCNFILHSTCAKLPPFMTHPSHPSHILILLPTPSYPGGRFNCDACNSQGDGFSYHCSSCEYDLHVICASKPLKITAQFHSCPLELTFKNPYDNVKGFHCDVCRKIESKQWLYRCGSCEFDVHMDCTIPSPTPVNQDQDHSLQHQHHSFSGEIVHNQNHGLLKPNQSIPSASNRAVLDQQFQANPVASGEFNAPVRPNYSVHRASIRSIQNMVPQTLMNVSFEGIVEGASQLVNPSLVQNLIRGDGSSSGGPGGDDESSFPGSTFGDSSGL